MMTCSYDNPDVEPTCPKCGHYNAMLTDHDANWEDGEYKPTKEIRLKCRDCGAKATCI